MTPCHAVTGTSMPCNSPAREYRAVCVSGTDTCHRLHLCVTMRHVGREQEFLQDLQASVAEVRVLPKDEQFSGGSAPMYGVVASLPDRSLIADFAHRYLETMLDA